ncbi:glycosyltransferase family 2 protein [Acidimangrovimonas sediminis]|uniref:glycosyltransferase family 2 protein n=1 Tax=Acidimangrovimonas sediminis TaxID=2056283 RepID=UPI000C7F9C00|nr:glycosyltransferase family 2 protein [Acidimangrovimonas sediminis]
MTPISCIIPVHNEAPRVAAVLAAVAGHPDLSEVIVVDDGSTDGTPEVVEAAIAGAANTRLIRLSPNRGKTGALSVGIAEAGAPLLMLIDGDLQGLTPAHVAALAAPVRDGRAEMSISLRDNAPKLWHWIGIDYISGERVLPRAVLEEGIAALDRLPKFGFEVHLNSLALGQGARIAVVRWQGVRSPLKGAKMGRWRGIRADARMMGDIFRTVPPQRLLGQIARMRARRVA